MQKFDVVDFIWNITRMCPYNCTFCCTDADYVKPSPLINCDKDDYISFLDSIEYCSDHLSKFVDYGYKLDSFDYELIKRQRIGSELNFKQKINIISNIDFQNVHIDIAGGDPLICYENFIVADIARKKFGRDNISVTTTGKALAKYRLNDLAKCFGKIEFTYDAAGLNTRDRHENYDAINLSMAKRLASLGVVTRAQTPLHDLNVSKECIEKIYVNLHYANVDTILLMRLFPVGRAFGVEPKIKIDKKEYIKAIDYYRTLEQKYSSPKVSVQCALKNILNEECNENPCDAGLKSFGINPYGQMLLCAWANQFGCKPLDDVFVIGDLSNVTFSKLTGENFVRSYLTKTNLNFGHCKVFSYIESCISGKPSLFSKQDPHIL